MDDKCKWCMNREEICNDSMRILCKRNGFDAFSPVTNADKYFHYATDEEIACFLKRFSDCAFCPAFSTKCKSINFDNCKDAWIDWLKQEVSDGVPKMRTEGVCRK